VGQALSQGGLHSWPEQRTAWGLRLQLCSNLQGVSGGSGDSMSCIPCSWTFDHWHGARHMAGLHGRDIQQRANKVAGASARSA
jgi:hypothetical protein